MACGTSDDYGYYSIEGLPNGAYKLKFDTTDAYDNQNISVPLTTSWLGLSYNNPQSTYALAATQIISTEGLSLEPRDLQLPLGTLTTALPTISGTSSLGSTLTGDPGEWGPEGVDLTYEWLRGSTVVGEGLEYEVQPGDMGYSLTFRVTGSMEFYTTTSRTSAARTVPVIPHIRGNVTFTGVVDYDRRGNPIFGIAGLPLATVKIYNATTGDYVDSVDTDGLGNYTYIPEGPGSFKIFVDPSSAEYEAEGALAPEWFANVPDISLSTAIPFTTKTVTGKNVHLAPEASIFGSVWYRTAADEQGYSDDVFVGGVEVCAYFSGTLEPFACSTSDYEGDYWIDGLPNGAYKLKFDTTNASVPLTTSWLGLSYNNPQSTYALAATQIISTEGMSLGPRDLQLPPGTLTTTLPTISGSSSVGSTLTGDPGEWGPEGVDLTYEWLRGSTVVGDLLFYDVQPEDVGKSLTFRVTGSMEFYTDASRTSAAVIGGYAWGASPTPTISGTAKFGQTLTANTGTWTPVPTSFTYQWLRGTTVVGTAKTYVLQATDIGFPITVNVTGVKTNYASSPQTSEATVNVTVADYTTVPPPTITGNLNVGQVLTAVTGTWSPAPTSFTYQWRRDGGNIGSATASTYTLSASDLGKQMSVVLTPVKAGYASTTQTSASSAVVAATMFTAAPVPTITGTVKVGSTLTGVPGTWNPVVSSSDFGWAWSISGSATGTYAPIAGATASTYVLQAADSGKFVKVTVTGKKSGYADTARSSVATVSVTPGTFATPPVPMISGTAKVGQTLTANAGTWSPVTDSYTYVWSSSATATGTYAAISGATTAEYELKTTDRGKFIKVAVTGVKSGYTSTPSLSAATTAVVQAFTTAATPTITGTVQVGKTLTAVPGTWSPVAAFTYQWKRTAGDVTTNISGATTATYVLTGADRGAVISVAVTGAAATYETTTKTSDSTVEVASGVFTTAPTPTITGSAITAQTLTAVPGTWAPTATFTYRWLAGTDQVGTASTLPVTADMVGKQITVEVTGAATGYTSQTKTSASTAAVTLPLIAAAPTPTISGTVKFGNTLTAAAGTAPAGATVKSYQWSRATTATGVFENITDATSSTYVLTASDVTKFIRVTVTWQKSGSGDTPKTSASTVVVAAGTFATPPVPTISGTAKVGQTLTANAGTWSPVTDSYTYVWSSSATATGTYAA
ncbi:MAG: hypothetical protein F2785_04040, partial [Actinobacteria bacterium]|nr:hypothetical protein [Actinomycetota bacterium]